MSTAVDTVSVEEVAEGPTLHARIEELIVRTEQMLVLTTGGRNMFSASEVMDLALDCRTALAEAKELVPA